MESCSRGCLLITFFERQRPAAQITCLAVSGVWSRSFGRGQGCAAILLEFGRGAWSRSLAPSGFSLSGVALLVLVAKAALPSSSRWVAELWSRRLAPRGFSLSGGALPILVAKAALPSFSSSASGSAGASQALSFFRFPRLPSACPLVPPLLQVLVLEFVLFRGCRFHCRTLRSFLQLLLLLPDFRFPCRCFPPGSPDGAALGGRS